MSEEVFPTSQLENSYIHFLLHRVKAQSTSVACRARSLLLQVLHPGGGGLGRGGTLVFQMQGKRVKIIINNARIKVPAVLFRSNKYLLLVRVHNFFMLSFMDPSFEMYVK